MEPFFDGGEVDKAEEHAVEFVKVSGHTPEDFHSLKEVFNQMSGRDCLSFCVWGGEKTYSATPPPAP